MTKKFQDRWYQSEASDAVKDFITDPDVDPDSHPIVAVPTGGGKTVILCRIIDDILTIDPRMNILVLSHVREIIEQNHASLESYFGTDVGLYSAGLGSRTIKKITVAGIQSVYSKPELFYDVDYVLIDECHTVPVKGEGMYRSFLGELEATYIGLSATIFRLGHGYIHEGKGALFTDLVYDLTSRENFSRLVREGFLSRLISKRTLEGMDTDDIKVKRGDFALDDMSLKFDREAVTKPIVNEVVKFGKNYKKWLIFAIDISHAEHIAKMLNDQGVPTACVHSKMKQDRETVINDIKKGKYRATVNVDVLTTGFDVPDIDLIAIMRPTKSPVFHVQSVGRGLRVVYGDGDGDGDFDLNTIEGRLAAIEAGPKQHCLVLDFAGNTERLGPVDDIQIKTKDDKKKGSGEAITKTCPECDVIHHAAVRVCDVCGYEFPFRHKLDLTASNSDITSSGSKSYTQPKSVDWYDVTRVSYSIHSKKGSPSSLKVTYHCGIATRFNEWVCYDHKGFPKHKADSWVAYRVNEANRQGRTNPFRFGMPNNLRDLYKHVQFLAQPKRVLVDTTQKFANIKDSEF